ncbi:uncharacterized protein METZ01_LOCUS318604, partial [marine metagenome]
MHAGEEHSEDKLVHEQDQLSPELFSTKLDTSLMIRIPAGTFKMGSSFVENKKHTEMCRKYDNS